jgi:hypothetical protein
MKTVHEWIRCHMLPVEPLTLGDIDSQSSVATDPHFDELCLARRRMGYLRYESRVGVDQVGYFNRAHRALLDYENTRNREYLLDASNYIRREWRDSQLIGTFFEADDSH